MEISKNVFVVTGGGNGIGRELVLGLIARGARVAAVDLSEGRLAETARLAAAGQGRLTTHVLDITERAAVERLPAEVGAAHGQVDGVLNVAGIAQRFARVYDLAYEEIERVMAVNFWGAVNVTKAFLPILLDRPQASVVNVSSMGGLLPIPGASVYGASKAALKALSEGLHGELLGTSVAVTVVFPGLVRTNILANSGVGVGNADAESSGIGLKQTTAAEAARKILDAVSRGRYRVRIGSDARLFDWLSRLMPQRATKLIANRVTSLLDS